MAEYTRSEGYAKLHHRHEEVHTKVCTLYDVVLDVGGGEGLQIHVVRLRLSASLSV